MKYLPYVFLGLLVIIESSVIMLPLVLIFLLVYAVTLRSEGVFLLAFVSGLVLDIMLLRPIGLSSMFFLLMLFLVHLYERKFELGTYHFVGIAAFFFSSMYFLLFPTQSLFLQSVVCVIISLTFFTLTQRLTAPNVKVY